MCLIFAELAFVKSSHVHVPNKIRVNRYKRNLLHLVIFDCISTFLFCWGNRLQIPTHCVHHEDFRSYFWERMTRGQRKKVFISWFCATTHLLTGITDVVAQNAERLALLWYQHMGYLLFMVAIISKLILLLYYFDCVMQSCHNFVREDTTYLEVLTQQHLAFGECQKSVQSCRTLRNVVFAINGCKVLISMGQCKKDATPLLKHWYYVFLALTYRSMKWGG